MNAPPSHCIMLHYVMTTITHVNIFYKILVSNYSVVISPDALGKELGPKSFKGSESQRVYWGFPQCQGVLWKRYLVGPLTSAQRVTPCPCFREENWEAVRSQVPPETTRLVNGRAGFAFSSDQFQTLVDTTSRHDLSGKRALWEGGNGVPTAQSLCLLMLAH